MTRQGFPAGQWTRQEQRSEQWLWEPWPTRSVKTGASALNAVAPFAAIPETGDGMVEGGGATEVVGVTPITARTSLP